MFIVAGGLSETAKVRIDRWLWAARIYKTRSLASVAVKAGHVEINRQKARNSRRVDIGDTVVVRRREWHKELIVTGLSDKRGSATQAAGLYEETPDSLARRAMNSAGRRAERAATPAGKPDKRGRRLLRRLAGRQQDN
ncbi:MAG: RNA-binding S4 domain-containing protein [Gammaproteobacteria bacterium]|nr:RNA-binding S4 domain-containing protein [Gammaproteobacteria bacterium]